MIESLISEFTNAKLVSFLRSQNSSFVDYEEDLSDIVSDFEKFGNLIKLGEIEYDNTDKLMVFTCKYQGELTSRSSKKAQYEIAKKALKEDFQDGAVFVFYDQAGRFRFSFIRRNYGDKNQRFTPWKRYTYFVEPDSKTNRTFIERVGACKFDSLDNIQQAFSVEKLTKDFYKELSDWYFWAIKNVSFPNDIVDDSDDEKYNSENIIRLITRLIFVWFLKQKGLIRNELFEPTALSGILKDFDAESDTQNNYYRAILQNLFFATLNQEIGQRGFAPDNGYEKNRSTYAIKNLYRYEKDFQNSTTQVMELFSQVPFLNGGLFECLDRKEKDGKTYDWDGFSRNPKYQASIPNALFFAKDSKVDLSAEYNDKKLKAVKVAGIIEILNRYNFTVEENTPVEVEVALDPELLGKVFENLLGAFNPETQETARKQTGSFYTPREIVNYMVDESLIAYFQTKVPDLPEDTLRLIFSYDDEVAEVDDTQRESLIQAAFDCKILDPACGSGAFPMGILQQMVHVLKKLDPNNTHWNNVVMTQAMKDFQTAENNSEEDLEERKKDIEVTFEDGLNHPDYARKLHIIENCIYGIDIQSIAVQISKLRFFISLVCEQGKNPNPTENFGIRPLPNLETKFVAANTLIGIEKNEEDMILFRQDKIQKLVDELKETRHRQFLVTNAQKKKALREKDEVLRHKIVTEVQTLYVKRADEDLFRLKIQLKQSEKELEILNKKPDVIQEVEEQLTIFGAGKKKTVNITENRRAELKNLITRLNKQITDGSNYSRLESVVNLASQLTSWNPYDQNDSSPFFDPEWMFGLPKQNDGYFDVVIGNPPYIQLQADNSRLSKLYIDRGFKTFFKTGDIYCLFYESGYNLLNKNGVLSYITPNTWLQSITFDLFRKFMTSNFNWNRILLADKVFEAVVDTNSVVFTKQSTQNECFVYRQFKEYNILLHSISSTQLQNDGKSINIEANAIEVKVFEKIIQNTHPLSTYFDVYNGVKPFEKGKGTPPQTAQTMKDKPFVVENSIQPSNEWKPLLRGSLMNRYVNLWNNNSWILYGKWLAAPRNPLIFSSKEKIIVRQTGDSIISTIIDSGIICRNNLHICISKGKFRPKILLSLLNSRLIDFAYTYINPEKGEALAEIKKAHVEALPVLEISQKSQKYLEDKVNEILFKKSENSKSDTNSLEQEIDNHVYRLYDLTYEEVKVIDPDIESKISEVEYNAINID